MYSVRKRGSVEESDGVRDWDEASVMQAVLGERVSLGCDTMDLVRMRMALVGKRVRVGGV